MSVAITQLAHTPSWRTQGQFHLNQSNVLGLLQTLFKNYIAEVFTAGRSWYYVHIGNCNQCKKMYVCVCIYIYMLLLLTAIELSLGGSSPYTSTDKTNKNKYT
jgi:hypothetical protein